MKRILSKNFILGLLVGMLIGLIGGWLESQVTVVTKSTILDCDVSIESLPPSEEAYRVKEILEKKYSNNND